MYKGRRRKSPRLKGFDYSSDRAFYVTVCTHGREHLFGEIVKGEMRLNELGDIVFWEWYRSEMIRKEIILDEFVIMPNHIHGVVFIRQPGNAPKPANPKKPDDATHSITDPHSVGTTGPLSLQQTPLRKPGGGKRTLSSMVGGFKLSSTIKINEKRGTPYVPVWQGRFHDEIIRNEKHLENVRQYIHNNPANWDTDEDNL